MIDQIKGIVKSKFEASEPVNLAIDEEERIESYEMMKESVDDMSMLYDLCTVDLYQDSS
jgi:hypothetical protein